MPRLHPWTTLAVVALALLSACGVWPGGRGPEDPPAIPLPWVDAPADASLAGTVRDSVGAALPGAHVCAWHHEPFRLRQADRVPRCAVTGPDGSFVLTGLVPAAHAVHASAPTFVPSGHGARVVVHAGQRQDGVDLVLAPGGVALHGRVVDMFGAPVADVWVTDRRGFRGGKEPEGAAAARSDADGRFTLWLAPGRHELFVATAEFVELSPLTADTAIQPVQITLGPGSVMTGTVVDASTRVPVAGARVQVVTEMVRHTGVGEVAYTDAAGVFRVSGLPPGRHRLRAETGNRLGEGDRAVVLGLGQTATFPPIAVSPAPSLQGQVRDCPAGSLLMGEFYEGIGVDGEVFIPSLSPGEHHISIDCEGRESPEETETIVVATSPLRGLVWQAGALQEPDPREPATPHRGEISGVMTDAAGQPARHVLIDITGSFDVSLPFDRLTDGSGAFALHGLAPGEYTLAAATRDEIGPSPPTVRVTVADAAVADVRLSYPATAAQIRGRVVRADAPVAGAVVLSEHEKYAEPGELRQKFDRRFGSHDAFTVTDADGRFTLPGGFAGSSHSLWAYAPGGGDVLLAEVGPGDDVTLDIPRPAALTGTFAGEPSASFAVGLAGGPIPRPDPRRHAVDVIPISPASSVHRLPEADELVVRRAFKRSDGRWGFEDLAPGTYDVLLASGRGCATTQVTLGPGERRDIHLEPGDVGTVRGQVIGDLGHDGTSVYATPADRSMDGLRRLIEGFSAEVDEGGRFELSGLCAGAYKIKVSTEELEAVTHANVAPRDTVKLWLELRPRPARRSLLFEE